MSEARVLGSAADLKFLHRVRQLRLGNFKSKNTDSCWWRPCLIIGPAKSGTKLLLVDSGNQADEVFSVQRTVF